MTSWSSNFVNNCFFFLGKKTWKLLIIFGRLTIHHSFLWENKVDWNWSDIFVNNPNRFDINILHWYTSWCLFTSSVLQTTLLLLKHKYFCVQWWHHPVCDQYDEPLADRGVASLVRPPGQYDEPLVDRGVARHVWREIINNNSEPVWVDVTLHR